jgi:hypothetical protein
MHDFITQIKEPNKIDSFTSFMSTFLAARVLLGSIKNFLLLYFLSIGIIITSFVPLLGFIAIPAFLSSVLLITLKTHTNKSYTIKEILKIQSIMLGKKVLSFIALSILPISFIIAASLNFYHSFSEKSIDPNSLYILLGACFLSMLWGIVIMISNAHSLRNDIKISHIIIESIDALIKNPLLIFMTFVQWFLTAIVFFFMLNISIVVISQSITNPVILHLSSYISVILISALFLSFYLSHISTLAVYILSNDTLAANQDIMQ